MKNSADCINYFYSQIEKDDKNKHIIESLDQWANNNKKYTYVINRPLWGSYYTYSDKKSFVLLSENHKPSFINMSDSGCLFDEYVNDFIEDMGCIIKRYDYDAFVGRPRQWLNNLIINVSVSSDNFIQGWIDNTLLEKANDVIVSKILMNLLIGQFKIDLDHITIEENGNDCLLNNEELNFLYTDRNTYSGSPFVIDYDLLFMKIKQLITTTNYRIGVVCNDNECVDSLKNKIVAFFDLNKVDIQIGGRLKIFTTHTLIRFVRDHYVIFGNNDSIEQLRTDVIETKLEYFEKFDCRKSTELYVFDCLFVYDNVCENDNDNCVLLDIFTQITNNTKICKIKL